MSQSIQPAIDLEAHHRRPRSRNTASGKRPDLSDLGSVASAEAWWSPASDIILMKIFKWGADCEDVPSILSRPRPCVTGAIWHNKMVDYQLGLLKRQLWALSQYSSQYSCDADSKVVNRVLATSSGLTTEEEAHSWNQIRLALLQIGSDCSRR